MISCPEGGAAPRRLTGARGRPPRKKRLRFDLNQFSREPAGLPLFDEGGNPAHRRDTSVAIGLDNNPVPAAVVSMAVI